MGTSDSEETESDSDNENQVPGAVGVNNFQFIGCNINSLHAGNVVNFVGGSQSVKVDNTEDDLKDLKRNLKAQLRAMYTQEYASITCLPCTEETDEEVISIETQYSPLSIRETKETKKATKNASKELELNQIIGFVMKVKEKVLIEGDAGYGKTVLARKLSYDWVEGSYLNNFEFLFHVSLRSFEHDSIFEYLRDDILKRNKRFSKSIVEQLLKSDRILIILDDLHVVDNSEAQIEHFFNDLPYATFVVLSQPLEKYHVNSFSRKFTKRLTLYGFTALITEQFVQNYFVDEPHKYLRFKKLLDSRDKIGQQCMQLLGSSPCLAHLLCILVKNKMVSSGYKITKLYTDIFEGLRRVYNEKRNAAVLTCDLEKALISFGKLVFDGLIDDRCHFKQDVIDKCDLSELITGLGFLRKNVTLFSDKKKIRFYQPLHRTFLDYLAAVYLSSLKDNPEEFDKEFTKLPDSLIHAKSTSESGSRLSLFVVFLSSLMGKDAHGVFLPKLNTRWRQYFGNFCDIMWLLWHSGLGDENISVIAKSDRMKEIKLDFLFRRDFKGELWTDVLCELFKHSQCSLNKLFLKYTEIVNSNEECKDGILRAMELNNSVTDIELEKSIDSCSINVGNEACRKGMDFFSNVLCKTRQLKKVTLNADIFVDNVDYHGVFFEKLFSNLVDFSCLEKLIINITQCTDLCDTFLNCDYRKCNTNPVSKKQSKKNIPKFENKQIETLINALEKNLSICEIQLPRVKAKVITLRKFAKIVNERVRVVKLPYLEVNPITTVNPLLEILLESNSRIVSIDLTGCKFTIDDALCLAKVLKCNKTLKELNLSRCLQITHLMILVEGLSCNQSLQHVNLSSNALTVDDHDLEKVIDAFYQSRITELHLSGWIFELRKESLANKIWKFYNNSSVEFLCLKNAVIRVNFHGRSFETVMETLETCLNVLSDAKAFDLRAVQLQELQTERRLSDGGYCSMSPETESLNSVDYNYHSLKHNPKDEIDSSSEIINTWKINEIRTSLRITSSDVKLLCDLTTFSDYKECDISHLSKNY